MNYFIITGASRGFGKAVALRLLASESNFVITISRSNPELQVSNTYQIYYDLSELTGISVLTDRVFALINFDVANSVFLINNAGVVAPMGPLDQCSSEEIIKHFNINALAPALISSQMINRLKEYECKKGIVNISSGASGHPYRGWSSYCCSKATLEMLTQCLSLENPEIFIRAYDPGVMDTSMQEYIRSQPKERFPMKEKFQAFQDNNKLVSPEGAAEKFVSEYLFQPQTQYDMTYKVLHQKELVDGDYLIKSISESDMIPIMHWRNEQIDILRQKDPLTEEMQIKYFKEVLEKDFELNKPNQILVSFFNGKKLIGYGGLVHIHWTDRRAEVSFILSTERNRNIEVFKRDYTVFLNLIKKLAFEQLNFNKLTTEAFDLRPYLIETLENQGFVLEGKLRKQNFIEGRLVDSLLHACFNSLT